MPLSSALLRDVENIALEAGAVVRLVYEMDFSVQTKADESPVTIADQQAEAVILAGLANLDPGIPVVAEESVAAGRIPTVDTRTPRFWLVDPLDGTKEFI
ncbi:MAG: 3'(2'),5'-bisphosphate nucleotidase CysQ, partial [Gammaproteobacteria bacterium]